MTWEEETVFVLAVGLLDERKRGAVVFDDREAAERVGRRVVGGKRWSKAFVIDRSYHGLPGGYLVRVVSENNVEAAHGPDEVCYRVQGTAQPD